MTTCEEAKQMRTGINITAKLRDKGEVRTVNTKFGKPKFVMHIWKTNPVESNLHFGVRIQRK